MFDKSYFIRLIILISALIYLISCGSIESEGITEVSEPENTELNKDSLLSEKFDIEDQKDTFPSHFNDVARIISGLMVDSNSHYYKYTQQESWISYSENLSKDWEKMKRGRFALMTKWCKTELTDSLTNGRPGIYPFSGPDFLTFNIFFPNSPSYYMFGLEPLGDIPDIGIMSADSLKAYYLGMEDATEDLLKLTFFRTNWMETELKKMVSYRSYYII